MVPLVAPGRPGMDKPTDRALTNAGATAAIPPKSLGRKGIDEPVHDRAGVLASPIVLLGVRNVERGLAHCAEHGQRGHLDGLSRDAAGPDGTGEQVAHQSDVVTVADRRRTSALPGIRVRRFAGTRALTSGD
jgi:hypothetical protein